ncbi:LOW QUALITY PROTEIN: uncharacterized protein ACIGJ3_022369 [Trichechus inunguis]
MEAVQVHMDDKSHIKLFTATLEFADFYDFRSNYTDHKEGEDAAAAVTKNKKAVNSVLQQYRALGRTGSTGGALAQESALQYVQRMKSKWMLKTGMEDNATKQMHFRVQKKLVYLFLRLRISQPSPELVLMATSGLESLVCRATHQVLLLPPRPPTLRSSVEAMDPPPILQSSPEAMDPLPSQGNTLPPHDLPPATSSSPHYYLLIHTPGVPCNHMAQWKEGRRLPAKKPASSNGEEESLSCPCQECGLVCSSPMQLQGDLLMHSMVRLFTCDTCDQAFKHSSDLARQWSMTHNTILCTSTNCPKVGPTALVVSRTPQCW